jgi:organic radical activating enzyme
MNIQFNTEACGLNNRRHAKITHKYVNIYVKMSDKCQAKCKFCVYHNNNSSFKFNLLKFKQIINKIIDKNIHIHKVAFTGGEPTLDIPLLNKCIHFIKSKSPDAFVSVNTNGLNAHEIEEADSISL